MGIFRSAEDPELPEPYAGFRIGRRNCKIIGNNNRSSITKIIFCKTKLIKATVL